MSAVDDFTGIAAAMKRLDGDVPPVGWESLRLVGPIEVSISDGAEWHRAFWACFETGAREPFHHESN